MEVNGPVAHAREFAIPNRLQGRARRVLFVQATEPAAYPPLMHAAGIMAEAGWDVTFLSAPIADKSLAMTSHPRITIRAMPKRPSHVMSRANYLRYTLAAGALALRLRPDVIYASDALGAGPGLLATRLSRASLVYHEHDSPTPNTLRPWMARLRGSAARAARLVVFPNAARARLAQAEVGFRNERLHIVWNAPRVAEIPARVETDAEPLRLYYHGSITPERLPMAIVEAMRRFSGRVRLRVAGYEAPSARGYVAQLLALGAQQNRENLVEYAGEIPFRGELLAEAAKAHVGLALMPRDSADINMQHMTGASNKAFDYMAAGLALVVSDTDDWQKMYGVPGYARTCNSTDVELLSDAFGWFLANPGRRADMSAANRAKIESSWNYDTMFRPVITALSNE